MMLAYWRLHSSTDGRTIRRLISVGGSQLGYVTPQSHETHTYSASVPRAWREEFEAKCPSRYTTLKEAVDTIERFWIDKGYRILTEKESALL